MSTGLRIFLTSVRVLNVLMGPAKSKKWNIALGKEGWSDQTSARCPYMAQCLFRDGKSVSLWFGWSSWHYIAVTKHVTGHLLAEKEHLTHHPFNCWFCKQNLVSPIDRLLLFWLDYHSVHARWILYSILWFNRHVKKPFFPQMLQTLNVLVMEVMDRNTSVVHIIYWNVFFLFCCFEIFALTAV